MVALSQPPSSEIEVRVFPSGVTCRSDQPPKLRRIGAHRNAAAPDQAADAGGRRLVALEVQGAAVDFERLLLGPGRRQGRAGTGGGQQAKNEEGADEGRQGAPV